MEGICHARAAVTSLLTGLQHLQDRPVFVSGLTYTSPLCLGVTQPSKQTC